MKYKPITLANFRKVGEVSRLSEREKWAIEVVGRVLPFRTNNYIVNELIDWERVPDDPIFRLTFPQRGMLREGDWARMAAGLGQGMSEGEVAEVANEIRWGLNPHPAKQLENNLPVMDDEIVAGIQHKYRETVLFFPKEGQTCHAYCTFCFRWPQFTKMKEVHLGMRDVNLLIRYLQAQPEVTDLLITGGDPLIMRTKRLAAYIEPILAAKIPHLRTIRIGTKVLSFWPYRVVTDKDGEALLRLLEKIERAGLHVAIMAHVNHPQELRTEVAKEAIARIRGTGAVIRTQAPVMRHINDEAEVWARLWREQVGLGMVPYYMFVARNTGAQNYFSVPLKECLDIYREAYRAVSGICRTVRGPIMSTNPGKVQILDALEMGGEQVLGLRFVQGRVAEWCQRLFFGKYGADSVWLDDLEPVGGGRFF
ncbi:MAG TPA: lysine 2,3-aminomutase, partial [Anaerolineae bacterium]|nr:lysine 2,3-aminomutase [Anaerolineae bacterium]